MPVCAARTELDYLAHRGRIGPFRLHRPETLEHATQVLQRYGDTATVMGGGVDLLTRLKRGDRFDHLVQLGRVAELTAIELLGGRLRIGAAVTHRRLAADPTVRAIFPDLAAIWAGIGNPRVRAAGTVGGNLTVAAPHYDAAPLVAVLDGRLDYEDGDRRLLSCIDIPAGEPVSVRYEKSHKPVVSVATAARRDPKAGTWRARVAIGCAFPRPVDITVSGPAPVDELAHDVVRDLPEPLDDHIASAGYRRRLIEVLLRRALAEIDLRNPRPGEGG